MREIYLLVMYPTFVCVLYKCLHDSLLIERDTYNLTRFQSVCKDPHLECVFNLSTSCKKTTFYFYLQLYVPTLS